MSPRRRAVRRRHATGVAALAGAVALAGCAGPAHLEVVVAAGPERVELTDTPFFPQLEHQCGPAALATVLGAAGVGATPTQLAGEVYVPGRRGSLQVEMIAAVRSRGLMPYELDSGLGGIVAELRAGRPVLVLQKLGAGPWPGWHYAVVAGYDLGRQEFILRSGKTSRQLLAFRWFDATWSRAGRWAVVLVAPGEFPATATALGYTRSAAALEATGHADEARRAYEAAAQRWPGEAMPRLGLGNLAAARGDWAAAEQNFAIATRLDPGSAIALNNHAEALLHVGCPAAARVQVERALALKVTGTVGSAIEATGREVAASAASDRPGCPSVEALQLDSRP